MDHVGNKACQEATAKTVIVKKYYSITGQRVAMRSNGVVHYLHSDHLGSTSLTTNAAGSVIAEQKYLPYGEVRWSNGSLPTDRQFTDQRRETALGDIYDYRARFYSPRLGRFISADTLVPGVGSMSLNRYLYVFANPVKFQDPSGHDPLGDDWVEAFKNEHNRREPEWQDRLIRLFSIAFPDEYAQSTFYDEDGNYIGGSIEEVFGKWRPSDRTWDDFEGALTKLATFYAKNETEEFVRDVGTLFGGLPDRIEMPSTHNAVTGCATGLFCNDRLQLPLAGRAFVHLGEGSVPNALIGFDDRDSNVHHWAWSFVLGYEMGLLAQPINAVREAQQAGGWQRALGNIENSADMHLGNRGAQMGWHIRMFGASPFSIRFFWGLDFVSNPSGW